MGRGSTWSRQLPWLTSWARCTPTTRRGTAAATSPTRTRSAPSGSSPISPTPSRALGRPAIADRPFDGRPALAGVWRPSGPIWSRALVVEDMAPDFRGRTTGPWEPWLHALPGRIRLGARGFRRVRRRWPASTSSRRSTGPRPDGGCTGTPAVDRDRRRVGHPRLLGSNGTRCGCPRCSSRRATPSRRRGRCDRCTRPATGQRICACPAPVTWSTTTRPTTTATPSNAFLATLALRA